MFVIAVVVVVNAEAVRPVEAVGVEDVVAGEAAAAGSAKPVVAVAEVFGQAVVGA